MIEDVSLWKEIISSVLIILGVLFMLIAAIGLIRLNDFYIRNSASTKATTLGLGLILLGIAIYFNEIEVFLELGTIICFILIIAPLAAHVMARAAYITGIPFWKDTNLDEADHLDDAQ